MSVMHAAQAASGGACGPTGLGYSPAHQLPGPSHTIQQDLPNMQAHSRKSFHVAETAGQSVFAAFSGSGPVSAAAQNEHTGAASCSGTPLDELSADVDADDEDTELPPAPPRPPSGGVTLGALEHAAATSTSINNERFIAPR